MLINYTGQLSHDYNRREKDECACACVLKSVR